MTPKQFVRYTRKIDSKGLSICDGISEPMTQSLLDYFIPILFAVGLFTCAYFLVKIKWFKGDIK